MACKTWWWSALEAGLCIITAAVIIYVIGALVLLWGGCAAGSSVQQSAGGDAATDASVAAVRLQVEDLGVQVAAVAHSLKIGDIQVNNDPIVSWVMAGGLVLMGLCYPIGKLVWLLTGAAGRRVHRWRNGPA